MDEEKLKKLLGEQQEIVKGVREHFEKVEAGIFTKSEALEYEEKANKRFEEISKEIKAITDDLTARVGEIETKMKRLPQGGDKKDEVDIEKKAFNKWARFGSRVLEEDEQKALRPGSGGSFLSPAVMKAFDIDEKKVLTIAGTSGISYLAPPDMVTTIIKGVTEISPMREIADVKPCSGDFSEIPKRTGQFAALWVGEIGTKAETEGLAYGMEQIPNHEMYALVKVSKRSLEDAAYNLEAELNSEFTEQFGLAEGAACVSGNGVHKCEGFLVNADVNKATVVYDHSDLALIINGLIDLLAAPKSRYAQNGTIVANRATIAYMRKAKDANSKYYWEPDWQKGTPGNFLGSPVKEFPDMPACADGAYPMAFGDFKKGYVISDRVPIEIQRLVELYAESGQVGFIARKRVGGQVVLPEAIYVGVGQA